MKAIGECDSGYVGDNELVATTSSSFTNIRIIRRSAMSVTASAERFGHRWLLKALTDSYLSPLSTLSSQRLKKEFEITSRLNHPAIVKAISLENVEGLGLTMVMEWIEGETLESLIAKGKLKAKEQRRMALEIVEAVAYMHKMGIVHRDLKLSNIMVRNNGLTPVIVDFGLADTDAHTTLKQAAGSEGYMSPEAYQKHEADTRDDVYSLGVMLQRLSVAMPGVVRKCLAPQAKRYANAHSLLLAMKRHKAMSKALRWVAAAVVAAAILGTMGHEIARLQRLRGEDIATVESLRDSISNISILASEGEQTISRLNDSISELQAKVSDAASRQELIDRHNAEIARVVKNGVSIVEAIFQQYNSEYISSLQEDGMSLSDISVTLTQIVADAISRYLDGARNSLSPDDYAYVYKEVWQREVMLYDHWRKNVLDAFTYDSELKEKD